jgi:hypothetical protein
MSRFKPDQRHLTIQGRGFHFVSYEGGPAQRKQAQPADPAMWYLMVEGRRRAVGPCNPQLTSVEIDTALTAWAVRHALGPTELGAAMESAPLSTTQPRWANWWGPG